jgi:seryl-tRNA synthetase
MQKSLTKSSKLPAKRSQTISKQKKQSLKIQNKPTRKFSSSSPIDTPDDVKEVEFVPVRPKFDYKFIKENRTALEHSMETRNYANASTVVESIVNMIEVKDALAKTVQDYRTYHNYLSEVSRISRGSKGTTKKPTLSISNPELNIVPNIIEASFEAILNESKRVKEELSKKEIEFGEIEDKLEKNAQILPNITHPDVPVGEEDNATILRHVNSDKGSLSYYKQKGIIPQSHLDIVKEKGLVDFDAAGVVSGSRFYYLKGNAALLEMALINFGLSKLIKKGYTPVLPPDMARLSIIEAAGFQSKDDKSLESQVYRIEGSDLTMSATAEIPLAGMYLNQILSEDQLPIKMVGYNHCFRPEVGGHGVSSRGLYRVHQFSKVEMFVIATPEQSDQIHQELIDIEIELFTELGLNFKVLDMPTGDLGAPAYRKIDMEASMPGRALNMYQAARNEQNKDKKKEKGKKQPKSEENVIDNDDLSTNLDKIDQIGDNFGEISSTSNCTDYQARRLNIRYRPKKTNDIDGNFVPPVLADKKSEPKTKFVHTLNGTACAIPRLIVSILEQCQEPDGKVKVPTALQPFMLGGPVEYL